MLVPGPFDVAFGTLGVLIFKHPVGFVIGVAAYNVAAVTVVAVGLSGVLDEVGHKTELHEQSVRARARHLPGYCDPKDPPWWCV